MSQDTTLPPLLVALKEKISEAIKVSDDVGRSRGSNCYAHNTSAVVKICELQDGIERDLTAIAAQAPQPTCVWSVESKTFRALYATKADAEKFVASLPITVSGGVSVSAVPVIGAQQAQGVPADPIVSAWQSGAKVEYFVLGGYDSEWTAYAGVTPPNTKTGRLKWRLAAAPQAEPQPEREPTTWSRYVAGMIACYLKWPDGDERTEAVAGIIERRRWSDRRTKSEPLSHVESESLQWLERLCEPALYLDRLGPIRDYLRAHGIGTKGGDTK